MGLVQTTSNESFVSCSGPKSNFRLDYLLYLLSNHFHSFGRQEPRCLLLPLNWIMEGIILPLRDLSVLLFKFVCWFCGGNRKKLASLQNLEKDERKKCSQPQKFCFISLQLRQSQWPKRQPVCQKRCTDV